MTRLLHGLRLAPYDSASGTWPDNTLIPKFMSTAPKSWAITGFHLQPNPRNLRILDRYLDRMIVNVRDPRPALLSYVHHLKSKVSAGNPSVLFGIDPPPPLDFPDWPLEKQIDFAIENYLPLFVQWLQGWVEADQDADFRTRILFTRHDDLRDDPDAFFDRILRFYGLDPSNHPIDTTAPKKGQFHFRQGTNTEWREVFSPAQITRCEEVVPSRLLNRFEWSH